MKLNTIRYSLILLFGFVLFYSEAHSSELVNGICLLLILLFGIPHGAVDHRMHLSTSDSQNVSAYILKYVSIGAAYVIWWLLDPTKALVAFIFLSAYHFGQEALEDAGTNSQSAFQSLIWGALILMAPLLYKFSDVRPYIESITGLDFPALGFHWAVTIPLILAFVALAHLAFQFWQGSLSQNGAVKLLFFFSTIILLHLLLPFVLAFTLYFVFFHSFNAFTHQYQWLSAHKKRYTIKRFVLDLCGFSVLAIFGIAFFIWALNPKEMTSLVTYFFILTSLITLPHAITLDQFYRFRRAKFSGSNA